MSAKPGPVGFGPYVALKVLRDELACDQTFVDMLVDEANISMFLNHQNVVSVLDLGADGGAYYIAMEYVQGITVERLAESTAARGKKLAIPVGLYVGAELCRALKYAHTRVNHQGEPLNIVHRDVTPANILLSTQGEVKLTDFGIARAKGRVHQTQAGVLKGKFGYMAPEMVRYERIDARADLFCAGVCLYLMLSGQHPVAGAAVMEAIQRYEEKRIPPPSAFNPAISPELDRIVMRCLEPKVEHRWATAAALGDALRDVTLKTPAWRAAGNDGARLIAQQIRDVAPEVFDTPVSSEQTRHLLERARADRARAKGESRTPAPLGQERLAELRPRIPSAMDVSGLPDPATEDGLAYAGADSPIGPQDMIELPTATSLPAISADMDFGATPAILSPDRETDEQLQLHSIEQARRELAGRGDTDASPAGPTDDGLDVLDDSLGAVPSAPADATVGAPIAQPHLHTPAFPDTSTDRSLVAEAMMEEPSLPEAGSGGYAIGPGEQSQDRTVAQAFNYDEEVIDRVLAPSTGDDGATVVGYEDGGDVLDQATVSHSQANLDATLAGGLNASDFDFGRPSGAPAGAPAVAPVSAHPRHRDDSDAATIIPAMPGPGMFDTSEWAPDQPGADLADATLLDGVNTHEVQAALAEARARQASEAVVTTESPAAQRLDSLAMEALVLDSVQTGRGQAQDPAARSGDPKPLVGPVRLDTFDRPPGAVGPGDVALPPSKSPAPNYLAPQPALRLPPWEKRGPEDPEGVAVGDSTGRWMAGQLDAGALAWDDDAAARRAVATRNQPSSGPGPISSPPQPLPMPSSSQVGFQMQPPYPGAAPTRQPSFLARNGLLLVTLVLSVSLVGGVAYAWLFTRAFWPQLNLESEPSGAMVVVDGSELPGNTPVKVRIEPKKEHTVVFRHPGFRTTTHKIADSVSQLGQYRLKATLLRAQRQLHLPAEGTVFINGAAVATGQEVELSDLPAQGPITLRVEAKGYRPYQAVFDDADEIPQSLDVPLSRL